ncbi:MAG: glutamine synthetase, partial [Eubacteriales bacterium]|nr:glutamine synthetase [Eubacteriales bacterium]
GLNMIPSTFGKALELAQGSDFVMKTLGRETVRKYIDLKSAELSLYLNASNTYQHFINEYFRVI